MISGNWEVDSSTNYFQSLSKGMLNLDQTNLLRWYFGAKTSSFSLSFFCLQVFVSTISVVKMTHKIWYMRNTCCEFLLAHTYHDGKNRAIIRLFMISKYQDKCKFWIVIPQNETLGKNPLYKNTTLENIYNIIYCNYVLFRYQNSTCCSWEKQIWAPSL